MRSKNIIHKTLCIVLIVIIKNAHEVESGPHSSRRHIREIYPPDSASISSSSTSEYNEDNSLSELSIENPSLAPYSSSPNFDNYYTDLESSASTHILSLVKKKKKYKSNPPPQSSSTSTTTTTELQTSTENSSTTFDTTTNFSESTGTTSENWFNFSDNSTEEYTSASTTENYENEAGKILQEVFQTTDNDSNNNTNSSWLKEGNEDKLKIPLINLRAALPFEILNATAESDISEENNSTLESDEAMIKIMPFQFEVDETINSTNFDDILNSTESITQNATFGTEAYEFFNYTTSTTEEGITEVTLKFSEELSKNNSEIQKDRSIEMVDTSDESTYKGEQTTPKTQQHSSSLKSEEENASIQGDKNSEADDMLFLIDLSNEEEEKNATSLKMNNLTDVEMINMDELQKNASSLNLTQKSITKRETDDAIFYELNQELGLGPTERPKTDAEDKIESTKIFSELMNEIKNPPKNKNKGKKTPEDEQVEKLTNALGKLLLRGTLDVGVLGVLRDFFNTQNRAYDINFTLDEAPLVQFEFVQNTYICRHFTLNIKGFTEHSLDIKIDFCFNDQMENLRADFDYEEIFRWVDGHKITRQKRNVHRDFSDAVPLAEILKEHYPKLVQLHNYTPTHSYTNKLVNWETLNKKVLSKIHIPLTREKMEQLAKSRAGVIENVLFEIKQKVETKAASGDKEEHFYDTIEFEKYEKCEKNLHEKEETIKALTQKIEHLENLLKIKDERIEDLAKQLDKVTNEELGKSPKTRFFNGMF